MKKVLERLRLAAGVLETHRGDDIRGDQFGDTALWAQGNVRLAFQALPHDEFEQ